MIENFNLECSLSQNALVCIGDSEGKLLQVSEQFCTLAGYSREELIGQSFLSLTSGTQPMSFFAELWGDLTDGKCWQGELSNLTKSGEFYWVQAAITPVMDSAGRLARFVCLQTDVTQYKRSALTYEQEVVKLSAVVEDLALSRDAAIQADRIKYEFLAGLNSSFQPPLGAILKFAQLLERSSKLKRDKQHLEYARKVGQAGQLLVDTLDDLLAWSRAEAGSLKLKIEPLMLQEVAESALSSVRALASERGVGLIPPARDVRVYAECDGQRLHQVLCALLSITVENSGEGGQVSLTVRQEENEAKIVVGGSMCGISSQLGLAEQPDTCVCEEASAFYQGPGLRQALALSLMQVMGGSLNLGSQLGCGEFFTLTLPLSHAMQSGQYLGRKLNLGRPLLILSIEDNLANARLLSSYVDRLEGATLLEASTAFQGMNLAEALNPDLILMDLHLPGMSGYEALRRIKTNPRLARIKVVALTSDTHPDQVRRGLKAGFDAYLTKPLMFESLVATLTEAGQPFLPQDAANQEPLG